MLPFALVGSLLPGADPGKEIGTAADGTSNSTLGLGTIQMIDVCIPTSDGRWLIMPRYTQPDDDLKLLLHHLHLELPSQPPPRITAAALPAVGGAFR